MPTTFTAAGSASTSVSIEQMQAHLNYLNRNFVLVLNRLSELEERLSEIESDVY